MAIDIPSNLKQILETLVLPADLQAIPSISLKSVTSKSGLGVFASSDTLYKGAVFGRDSLEVAEDLMALKPKLVGNIIKTLARLQGLRVNPENEEEPGKIIHEYRSVFIDGKKIADSSLQIFETLSDKWGGSSHELAYYGSVDSTPQFLRVLGRYCKQEGRKILGWTVVDRAGETRTLEDAALAATEWLVEKINDSRTGLLEFQRANPHGLPNQVWKDSEEFYVHENGQSVNHDAPIASIEVQGLAYDGLLAAAEFWPEKASVYQEIAERLRDRTIELLWEEDRHYFALGTDFDKQGDMRVIQTKTANPAALLDSGFWDNLSNDKKQKYITGLAETIMSSDFLTDAGIRSRALSEGHLVNHWDYHGSFVSWPKETYDIAKGLRRQGFEKLAQQLENRLLNTCVKFKAYPEFVYVDGFGRVLAGSPSSHSHGEVLLVEATNQPERVQAWTVSAAIAISSSRLKSKIKLTKERQADNWQTALEKHILVKIPKVDRHLNPFALKARYPTYKYKLNSKQ